jgi:hypothetical protein
MNHVEQILFLVAGMYNVRWYKVTKHKEFWDKHTPWVEQEKSSRFWVNRETGLGSGGIPILENKL